MTRIDLNALSQSVTRISGTEINGISKFLNDIRNGKLSNDSMDKVYRSILDCVLAAHGAYEPELGPTVVRSLEPTISMMRAVFSQISADDPIKYRTERLLKPDYTEIERFDIDATSANKRITKLLQLDDKSLCLPALKDEFIASFERVYKLVASYLDRLLTDGTIGKKRRYDIIETLLSLNWYVEK